MASQLMLDASLLPTATTTTANVAMNATMVVFELTPMQLLRPTKIRPTIVVAIGLAKDSNSMDRNSVVDTVATAARPCTAFDPKVANVDGLSPIEWPMRLHYRALSNGPSLDRKTFAMDCEDVAPEA